MKTQDIELFHLVADCQSFTQAANISDLPVANVSRRIKLLEEEIGFLLFQRTTRQLRITDSGQLFYNRTRALLVQLNETMQHLQGAQSELRGRLRIQLFPDSNLLLPALQRYQKRNPGVTFDLVSSDRELDLVENGFDLGVRIGELKDSSMVARRLGILRRLVVASPSYLEIHGHPETPWHLPNHNCILFRMPNGLIDDHWQVDKESRVKVSGDYIVNQQSMIDELVLSGHGIAFQPSILAAPLIQSGELVQLFEHSDEQGEPIWLVYPNRQGVSRLVSDFVDYIMEEARLDPAFYHFL